MWWTVRSRPRRATRRSPRLTRSSRRSAPGISEAFEGTLREVELLVPYADGARLSELYEIAGDLERSERPDGVLVQAKIPAAVAHRFAEFAVSGNGAGPEAA